LRTAYSRTGKSQIDSRSDFFRRIFRGRALVEWGLERSSSAAGRLAAPFIPSIIPQSVFSVTGRGWLSLPRA
jgi:hypothetical protein